MPVASATASPPLDPPQVRVGFQGLRVSPCRLLSVCQRSAMSGMLVRATGMAPAARMRSTTGASIGTTACVSGTTPQVVAWPVMSTLVLTVNGTPCSGPSGSPAATFASAAHAEARASSCSAWTTALTVGLTSSIRFRWASITSTQLTSLAAMCRARSRAGIFHRACMAFSLR